MKTSNVILEIIEWRSPKLPAPTDEGPHAAGFHIVFEVPDIEAVFATLSARGIEFVAKPDRFMADDAAPAIVGATFVYFKDPDGIGLAIYQKRSRFNDF